MVRNRVSFEESTGPLPRTKSNSQSGQLEVLYAGDNTHEKRWAALVENSPHPDVYYLPGYAQANAEIEQTEPLALITNPPSDGILAPFLVRRASAKVGDSTMEWLDASTPYGYGGLLNLSDCAHPKTVHSFFHQLNDWCADCSIVCCVIRLHPFLDEQNWADLAGTWQERLQIHSRGPTYSVGLSEWNMELNQPISLRRDRKADMRLAGRNLRVVWATGADDDIDVKLDIFAVLYNELINRNKVESFYRFPKRYFEKLAKLGKRLGIALAMYGDDPAGGNIFLLGSRYAHGHLAVTNDAGRKYGAPTLLIIEGARQARQLGCELLHLGGGVKLGDSLEEYKRSFGGPGHIYRYLIFIADPNKFEFIRGLPSAPWPYHLASSAVEANGGSTP
jgi:hypothetical protein